MAANQTNKKMRRNSKATTILDLYTDCLVSVLAFGEPLEMWDQRLTYSHWRKAVPIALSQVASYEFDGLPERHLIRRVVDLCPNLTTILGRVYDPLVKKSLTFTKSRFSGCFIFPF